MLIVVLLTILAGCKDEVSYTGQVKVTFESIPTNVNISISPLENADISIIGNLKINIQGTLTYELNPGNYILTVSASTFFPKVAFQIKAGQTTSIVYDPNNNGKVQWMKWVEMKWHGWFQTIIGLGANLF